MTPVRRSVRDVALLCLLAAVLYPLAWPQAPVHTGDSPQYLDVVQDLADGRLDELHDRSPGYPLLILLTRRTPGVLVASVLLHAASVLLLAALLAASGAPRRTTLVFAALLLLPPFVEPAGYLMTETLAQFTLAAGLVCLTCWVAGSRPWLLAAASAAFAYAALTRPAYQALAPAIAAGLLGVGLAGGARGLAPRRAIAGALGLILGTVLLVGAVSWWNHRAFGYFGLVPMTGYHLSTKTMNLWERLPDEYAVVRDILIAARDAERTRRGGLHTGSQAVWQAREELLAATGLTRAELSSYLTRMNLRLIRAAPLEYLQEVARSAAVYWFPSHGELAHFGSPLLRWLWSLLHAAIVGLLFLQVAALAGFGTFVGSRRLAGAPVPAAPFRASSIEIVAWSLAAAIVFYTMALSCFMDIGEPRQRRSTDALSVMMVAVGGRVWRRSAQSLIPHP